MGATMAPGYGFTLRVCGFSFFGDDKGESSRGWFLSFDLRGSLGDLVFWEGGEFFDGM